MLFLTACREKFDSYDKRQVKMAQPYRDEEGRCPYDQLLREGQVHCELAVVDPSNQCVPATADANIVQG